VVAASWNHDIAEVYVSLFFEFNDGMCECIGNVQQNPCDGPIDALSGFIEIPSPYQTATSLALHIIRFLPALFVVYDLKLSIVEEVLLSQCMCQIA